MRQAIIFLCMFFCATVVSAKDVQPEGVHPICQKIKFMSNDRQHYARAYDESYKRIASSSFIYALMASNVYEKYESSNPKFDIPDWQQVGEKRVNWRGFGAHIYKSTKHPETIAIAFEGTDPSSFADWIFGNLNIYWKGQYSDAEQLINEITETYPNAKIITAGHSLGGGLAIHAALHHSDITAFAFNSSPRIFMPDSFVDNGSKIILISENDDALGVLRDYWGMDKISKPYKDFDFLDLATNNNDKVIEHQMYATARGLMLVAASYGNPEAEFILDDISNNRKSCPGAE